MITNSWVRITTWAAVLVAVAAALHIVQLLYEPVLNPVLEVLAPVFIALALALLLDPVIDKLETFGLNRSIAVCAVAVLFLAVIIVLVAFLIPSVVTQAKGLADDMPEHYQKAERYVNNYMADHKGLLKRFNLPTTVEGVSSRYKEQIQSTGTSLLAWVGNTLSELLSRAIWVIIIPVLTLLFLIDIDRIKAKALLLFPERHRERTASLANSAGSVFGAYIRGLVTVAILYGIACGIVIAVFKVPYALMLGVLAGILSLVPYIGATITVVLVALVALVSHNNLGFALLVAIVLVGLNAVFDYLVSPRTVGKAVGIHPALAIVALLVGGVLFDFVGMILAVPVAASVQIIVLEFYPPLKGPVQTSQPAKRSILDLFKRKRNPK